MVGKIVISKKGRDMGKYLAVINCDKNYVFVADGKERKLETPKRKNIKHISITADTLTKDQMKTNKQLKKAIAVYKETVALKEEP